MASPFGRSRITAEFYAARDQRTRASARARRSDTAARYAPTPLRVRHVRLPRQAAPCDSFATCALAGRAGPQAKTCALLHSCQRRPGCWSRWCPPRSGAKQVEFYHRLARSPRRRSGDCAARACGRLQACRLAPRIASHQQPEAQRPRGFERGFGSEATESSLATCAPPHGVDDAPRIPLHRPPSPSSDARPRMLDSRKRQSGESCGGALASAVCCISSC